MAGNPLMILVSASSLALLVSGSGCAGARPAEAEPPGRLTITGQLAYRQRVALPPDASAVVELREIAPDGLVVAEQRIELGGKQVPVPFALTVERARLVAGKQYAVRGAFLSGGRSAWLSDPVLVDVKAERVELGVLNMTAVGAAAPATFHARGNEPGWRLDIAEGSMTLLTDYELTRIVMPAPTPRMVEGRTEYAARDDRHTMTVTISEEVCADSMSGMPHPYEVVVRVDGKELDGCGGDPATLLQAVDWVVESIDGAPLLKGSKVTVHFGGDGRVSGSASCNTFTGGYSLTGEGLSIQQPAATMRMCEAALMDQEQAFLKLLAAAKRFEILEGALVLVTADGRAVKARRGG